ncbi:MAG: PD-(D/E)XK nuclease family protein [Nanoarchaeota archaeon]|nr:PD-(D/E)XK nuclease family protein [Nanoarchaeota archaeon]
MPIYSHSKLSTFEQCKLKYKFRYIDKIIPEIEETIETHLGSVVHSTLEWLYKLVILGKIPSIDETIMHYHQEWENNWVDDIVIINKRMSKEDYFERGIRFILDYYIEHAPFNDNTIEIEKKIFVKIGDEEHTLQGFIDRLVHNIKTEEYEIHDYKTSGTLPSKERIENDRQLALYSIAIKEIFGNDKKVKLIWHYLHFNKKIEIYKTDEQIERLKEKIQFLINEIESTKEFPYNISALCDWCEYKNICPAWTKSSSDNKIIKSKEEREKRLSDFPTLKKYLKD